MTAARTDAACLPQAGENVSAETLTQQPRLEPAARRFGGCRLFHLYSGVKHDSI